MWMRTLISMIGGMTVILSQSSSEDSEIGNSDKGSEQDLIEPEQQKQNARGQKKNDFEKNHFLLPFMA